MKFYVNISSPERLEEMRDYALHQMSYNLNNAAALLDLALIHNGEDPRRVSPIEQMINTHCYTDEQWGIKRMLDTITTDEAINCMEAKIEAWEIKRRVVFPVMPPKAVLAYIPDIGWMEFPTRWTAETILIQIHGSTAA